MKLKAILIGCGRIAKKHIEVLGQIPDVTIVGVCDVQVERAEEISRLSGAPAFYNHLEMASKLKPDIGVVLTDSGSHVSVALSLVPYVKNLIVEKPMALTLDDADSLIEACAYSGVRLFVVKQNRYNLPVLKLRSALEKGRFGKMSMGTVRVRWCRRQKYYDQDAWRGTWRKDGGVFANQASHHIDLLQWMMGPVESVQAYTTTRLVDIETEDVGIAILRFVSGALGVIEATTATRPKDLEGSLSILGEHGSVVISGFAVNKIATWNFTHTDPDDAKIDDFSCNPPDVYGFGHHKFYQDILGCIESGKRAMLDGFEGRKSLELIIAIYQAAMTRKEVRLRYIPEHVPLGKASRCATPSYTRELNF